MKLLNFRKDNEVRMGLRTDKGILDLAELDAVPSTMEELIKGNHLAPIKEWMDSAEQAGTTLSYLPEEELVYAPALNTPGKIVCVGLNYLEHIEESRTQNVPDEPVLFSKFNNALAAHQESIPLPKEGHQFDYEGELVLIIGKRAKDIPEEEALSHVFGYTIGNDLSIRDLQFKSGQWLLGKTADKFAPVGPYIVTADEIDPSELAISTKRNGEVVQSSNTKYMIFNCAKIISYISRHLTLEPGDLIFTGTPEGVVLGYPEGEQEWLKPGDELEVTIEGIGTLRNTLD